MINDGSVIPDELAELSRKTGLVVRLLDSAAVDRLFAELEEYDAQERADTFKFVAHALNKTRKTVAAEPIYQ